MLYSKFNLINKLCTEAQKSVIDHQLAATIIKSGKMVTKVCCNSPRNTCRGACMGSLHAEANAILNYFGRSLSWDKKKGWCFLNRKVSKVAET
jgi:deoxycytidylate deaminase